MAGVANPRSRLWEIGDHLLVEDLVYTYKVLNYSFGRYIQLVKDGRESLLGPEQLNNRGWMERFFFVKMADLGLGADLLPGDWTARGIILGDLFWG